MSYQKRIRELQAEFPFDRWRSYLEEDDLTQYTQENCSRAFTILKNQLSSLIALGEDASESEKLATFQIAVEALNDLNSEVGSFIETGEREDLCELFNKIATAAGLEVSKYGNGEGPASEWRDW
ncbi:hypothetical protein C1752_00356 [Acaryochloris thomasi RCC1774]|uniref:Uncharacterized protein n=1 Tax=Acaryochloris thomasi RCC1774 TaxID=1764569 RepID=A0A2W1K7H0_9CYAN|nr:hypothetical protein [Acaryochloris thomasi]PZD75437.1 hypothetical protein C1752_00356 [Acaryochloris thomasi RCC1774]